MTQWTTVDQLVGVIVEAREDDGDLVLTYDTGRVVKIVPIGSYEFERFGVELSVPAGSNGDH